MKRKNKGYMIAVPDKNNPEIIYYHHVKGPKFLYGKNILEDSEDEVDNEIEKKKNDSEILEDDFANENIAKEIRNILKQKNKESKSKQNEEDKHIKDIASAQPKEQKQSKSRKKVKKSIKKPKTNKKTENYRYTAPKERGIVARIINRMKYEHDWYEDIEDYLYDNYYYATTEIEQSRTSDKRREQKLYKRVQSYEDARDDVKMKKAFIGMKVTAIATLLAASGFATNLLVNQINEIVDSGYIAQEKEAPKLANANEGQIQYAENVLSRIEYDFKYLSHTELLDTVIRSISKVSEITENKARNACKDYLHFADQRLLEEILEESYEGEYDSFSDEKKLELNQLVYEMLDEEAKFWVRSPEKVAEIKARNETENEKTTEMELD